jgi:hypothetical protein
VNGVVGLSVVVIIGYVIAARRSAGATLGEGLFSVDFRSVLRLDLPGEMRCCST